MAAKPVVERAGPRDMGEREIGDRSVPLVGQIGTVVTPDAADAMATMAAALVGERLPRHEPWRADLSVQEFVDRPDFVVGQRCEARGPRPAGGAGATLDVLGVPVGSEAAQANGLEIGRALQAVPVAVVALGAVEDRAPGLGQLGGPDLETRVTGPAASLGEAAGEDRVIPELDRAVCGHGARRATLATVTDGAAHLTGLVRNGGMCGEQLVSRQRACRVHTEVAGGAPIDHAELRLPDLFDG